MNENHPTNPQDDQEYSPADSTIDIDIDESELGDDLQAVADEADRLIPKGEPEIRGEASQESLVQAQKRIAELEKAQVDQNDKHHRLLADFANHRNRTGRDIQMAVTLAERKLLLEILPVVDSFERCIASTYSSVEDFHNGVTLIHKQFQEALRKVGVEGVDLKVGDPFDAMHAEALTTIHQADLPDGAVANIFERGYTLRNELLRPARVVVNHNDQAEASKDA